MFKKMIGILALAVMGFAAPAFADTVVTFDMPTSCSTYCSGYTTYSTDHTVGTVNVTATSVYANTPWQVNINVDGVNYVGTGLPLAVTTGNPYTATMTDVVVTNSTGGSITVSLVVLVKRIAVSSGRAHYFITRRWAQSGSVTFP